MKWAALYMRVSTKGHGQTTETQALALRDYAGHRGFTIVEEYRDEGISRARREGKRLGRPRVAVDPLQVAGLRALGYSWNQIAGKLGIGRGTADRAFKSLSQKSSVPPAKVSLTS